MTILDHLPTELSERSRVLNDAEPAADGAFVLYWMHHAMRAHDNPALDTAVTLAVRLGRPVLVYQGLAGAHPFNSDRHHFFILQAARDIANALAQRGICYAFHLPGDKTTTTVLPGLIDAAAAVVFEEMPVAPFRRWQPALAARANPPVISVDARCIVPMPLPGKSFDRAFKFRDAMKHEFTARIAAGWQDVQPADMALASQQLFEPLDIGHMNDADILERIARLPINHAIGPVADTPGGSDAGYQRWQTFRERGLKRYHRLRNDAAEQWPLGVSRMSAYLHYGQVSPFRLAAEAQDSGGAGADKFLEELTIWRELAHNFCFHCADADSLDAIPQWAQKTLAAHRGDARDKDLSLYRLQHANSGDALWDLAQRSLLVHGELHNNLRMSWAKALLRWTRSPEEALSRLIDLNHRYALDGNDPSSYGGLLWALGLFDRPFEPARAVVGTLRGRSLEAHAKRLDMDAYREHVMRNQGRRLRVAVIGAGLAGVAAARILADHNHDVVIVEKSRGPGGRMASRRRDETRFDHGAQYFTARDPRMLQHLESWQRDGIVEQWPQRVVEIDGDVVTEKPAHQRWRGKHGMNALTKALAGDLHVYTQCRVTDIRRDADQWYLDVDSAGATRPGGGFDVVIVSAPAPQAALLLDGPAPALAERAASVDFSPTWAVMLQTHAVADDHWQGAFVANSPVAWIGNRVGERDASVQWVIHASESWSAANLEADAAMVASTLAEAFERLTGLQVNTDSAVAHRWRYARVQQPLTDDCLFDHDLLIGACGDWCAGASRVESAWLSGQAIAGRVLASATLTGGPTEGVQATLL